MQARYYDPVIGRFYSNDPVDAHSVHSFNRYAYANNNPYAYTDPDGKLSIRKIKPTPTPFPITPPPPPNAPPHEAPNTPNGSPPLTLPDLSDLPILTTTSILVIAVAIIQNSENGVQDEYEDLESAVGSVNPLDEVEYEGKTKSQGLKDQGFTEKWSGTDSDGVIQTAFKNPKTGKYTGGHESSKNDKYW